MRILFLGLLISSAALAQIDPGNGSDLNCTHLTFTTSRTYNCIDVNISAPVTFAPGSASPVIIKVQGNVIISSSINLSGENGTVSNSDPFLGGLGGPAAGRGGGYNGFSAEDSPEAPLGGGQGSPSVTCSGGGGGGGFITVGEGGFDCVGFGSGGAAGADSVFNPLALRGGYGGGAGGEGPAGTPIVATAGGGGGAIHIMAAGSVLINGSIIARGGNGGNGPVDGGGGGGGSGGVIWIQSSNQITNNALLDVSGGDGGSTNTTAKGGDGGIGFLLLEDSDGVIQGTGTGASGNGSSSLKSDISCGTIMPEQKDSYQQLFYGFMLALIFGILIKTSRKLKFFPQA